MRVRQTAFLPFDRIHPASHLSKGVVITSISFRSFFLKTLATISWRSVAICGGIFADICHGILCIFVLVPGTFDKSRRKNVHFSVVIWISIND